MEIKKKYPIDPKQKSLESIKFYKGKDMGSGKTGDLLKCYTGDIFGGKEYSRDKRNWLKLDFDCNCYQKEECTLDFDNDAWDLQPSCKQEILKRYD
jgi:hypothetical protein